MLAQLDYVVASVHNAMNQDEEEMTARVIRAMENEYVTMLGHATGRLLLQREPYKINLEKIIDCAARTGTWIELNCSTLAHGHGLALVASRARQGREVRDQSRCAPHRAVRHAAPRRDAWRAKAGCAARM